ARIREALAFISAESYETWICIGMALHSTGWDERAFPIWDEWSCTAPEKYKDADLRKKWDSFHSPLEGRRPITLGTLFYMAQKNGWIDSASSRRDFHTDLGNARRLVSKFGNDIRYVHDWGKWIIWDGAGWRIDSDGAIMRLAKQIVESMYEEALKLDDPS